MQQTFGLIGKSLSHSFSQKYFNDFFLKRRTAKITNISIFYWRWIGLETFLSEHDHLKGFNVTIPCKTAILPFLASWHRKLKRNQGRQCSEKCGRQMERSAIRRTSLLDSPSDFLPQDFMDSALVMGQGGASRAVQWALAQRGIPFLVVNRASPHSFATIDPFFLNRFKLIVNTTPLGCISYPYRSIVAVWALDKTFYFYDLVYNPEKHYFELRSLHQVHIKMAWHVMDRLHCRGNFGRSFKIMTEPGEPNIDF